MYNKKKKKYIISIYINKEGKENKVLYF
jgi:hypothetical protein